MEYVESCPSCGAARKQGTERCELCGASLLDSGGDAEAVSTPRTSDQVGLACSSCGRENPKNARFCNQCGATLVGEEQNPRPSSAVGRRALLIIGVAVAIVVGLYLLSSWLSNRSEPVSNEATNQPFDVAETVPPLPDTLQQAADAFAAENTAMGWFEAGRYYLTRSWETQQSDPESSILWAQQSIAYFERSLAIEDNPDVRLAVAEAASLERSDPMRPIQEVQAILEEHPDHIGANLMLGERRVMIGRYEDAIEAFETVLEVAPDGDPRRVAAEQFLTETRRRLTGDG